MIELFEEGIIVLLFTAIALLLNHRTFTALLYVCCLTLLLNAIFTVQETYSKLTFPSI